MAEVETRAVALGQLIGVVGQSATELRAEAEPVTIQSPASLEALTAGAREHSGQLLALEAEVLAAEAQVASAGNANQVRVDLTGTLQAAVLFDDDSLSSFLLPGDRPALTGIVGIEVELPLGTSQQSAEHDQAIANREAAEARYEELARSIDADAAALRTTLASASERVALSAEATEVTERLAQAERARVQLGTGTAFEVLEAQQAAREAALELRRAQTDYAEAVAQLAHLVGALIEPGSNVQHTGAQS